MTTNCINCGAPLTGYICEYCGTRYEDTATAYLVKIEIGIRQREVARLKAELNRAMLSHQNEIICIPPGVTITSLPNHR